MFRLIAFHLALAALFGLAYPGLIWGLGQLMPEARLGFPLYRNSQLVGFESVGQAFTSPKYFWGRPSAVDYNAASTGGSNKAWSNPEYQALIGERLAALRAAHPEWGQRPVPVDLVTAGGSGLDPHISPESARLQVERVAHARVLSPQQVQQLVDQAIEGPWLGLFGPERINVLKLNLALDELNDQPAK